MLGQHRASWSLRVGPFIVWCALWDVFANCRAPTLLVTEPSLQTTSCSVCSLAVPSRNADDPIVGFFFLHLILFCGKFEASLIFCFFLVKCTPLPGNLRAFAVRFLVLFSQRRKTAAAYVLRKRLGGQCLMQRFTEGWRSRWKRAEACPCYRGISGLAFLNGRKTVQEEPIPIFKAIWHTEYRASIVSCSPSCLETNTNVERSPALHMLLLFYLQTILELTWQSLEARAALFPQCSKFSEATVLSFAPLLPGERCVLGVKETPSVPSSGTRIIWY